MPDDIRDGDYLLVDRNLATLNDGKIYVVEIQGDGFSVKRARKLNGSWYLVSDNPTYESFRANQIRVIGQVFQALGQRSLR